MKLALNDHCFYCLQERLLKEKTELAVYVDTTKIEGNFNVTSVDGKVTQTLDVLNEKADFYLTGTTASGHSNYDALTAFGKPALGYSYNLAVMESDRQFAFGLVKHLGLELSLPKQHVFTSIPSLSKFLKGKEGKKSWVLKQGPSSSVESQYFPLRTVITHSPHLDTLAYVPKNDAWFNEKGQGDVILEEFIAGVEVCFGAWFDGEKFLTPIYACEEHKDAQNGSRSLIQTGEVGTFLTWFHKPKGAVPKILRKLEPYLRGKCKGMIDFNTKINPETGEMHFIEFTPRFGRPTLELMLGGSDSTASWSKALHAIATGAPNRQELWSSLFKLKHTVGVCVYSYGYPLLNGESMSLPFQMPKMTEPSNKNQIQTCLAHLATYKDGVWHTYYNNRQFVVVGASNDLSKARELAYAPLKNYTLLGCTWRDDVAVNHSHILDILKSKGVLHD